MDLQKALLDGQQLLDQAKIPSPRLTAEVLLAHAIRCERAWLYAHSNEELKEVWWIHYGRYLHERLQGKPTQYITGRQEFYGRDFRVTPAVLIPRPETEHLIEVALERWRSRDGNGAMLDIGTGSGAIAVTLALETKARVVSTDISPSAIAVAQENARRLGAPIELVVCDLGSALSHATFDIVVSNPPYVPKRDQPNLQPEVRDHEPEIALYGGEDGLDIYRRLIPEAKRLLKPGGWLLMELGYEGVEPVLNMLQDWQEVSLTPDLAGIPRVISSRNR